MIICPICETEHETWLEECILCGGPLPQQVISEPQTESTGPSTVPSPPIEAPVEEPPTAEPQAPPEPSAPPQVVGHTPDDPPPPGTLCLIVYFKRRPALYFPVIYDEILIGRTDPASNSYPDLDVTPYDPELAISRKHAYLYREEDAHYIYPISNSGTQVNQEMVDIGAKKRLKEGDVVILSGRLAIRFAKIASHR